MSQRTQKYTNYNRKRRSCEVVDPIPLKFFVIDSRSTSSSTTQSPANFIIPPRENNPVLNDPQFSILLQSQLDSSASISDFSNCSSSTPNSFNSKNSLNSITQFLDNDKSVDEKKWNHFPMKQIKKQPTKPAQLGSMFHLNLNEYEDSSDSSEDEFEFCTPQYYIKNNHSQPMNIYNSNKQFHSKTTDDFDWNPSKQTFQKSREAETYM